MKLNKHKYNNEDYLNADEVISLIDIPKKFKYHRQF